MDPMYKLENGRALAVKTKPSGPDPEDPAVVFTFGDLAAIGTMLKRNVGSREELLAAISSLNTVNVEGVEVPLEPRLLQRLKSRCLDKAHWPEWLAQVVTKQLHDYAGW